MPTVIQLGLFGLLIVLVGVALWVTPPARYAWLKEEIMRGNLRGLVARWLVITGARLAGPNQLPNWSPSPGPVPPPGPEKFTGPAPRPAPPLPIISATLPTVGIAADNPPQGLQPVLDALAEWDRRFGFDPYRIAMGWTVGPDQELSLAQVSYTPGKKSSVIQVAWVGKTGTGKDVGYETALLALCSRARPEQFQVAIIDGGGVDYHAFTALPHLYALAETPDQLGPVIGLLEAERDARREALQRAGVKNIWQYNEWVRSPDGVRQGTKPMPVLQVYVAEITLLKGVLGDALWSWLNEMLAVGRKFGMHFVVSSQRLTGMPTDWRSQIDLFISLYQSRTQDNEPCTGWKTSELIAAGVVPPSDLPLLPGYATVVQSKPFNTRFGLLTVADERAVLDQFARRGPAEDRVLTLS